MWASSGAHGSLALAARILAFHGRATYESTIRTPLIIRQPGSRGAGTRTRQLVSNIDVMPTILDRLGVDHPARIEGVSFARVLDEQKMIPRGAVFAEATKPWARIYEDDPVWTNARKCRAIHAGRWKLIYQPADGITELYDLENDPNEQRNLLGGAVSPRIREREEAMKNRLTAWDRKAAPLSSRFDDTPQNIEALKALGYTGEASDGEEADK